MGAWKGHTRQMWARRLGRIGGMVGSPRHREPLVSLLPVAVVLVVMTAAALIDLKTRRIPNLLVICLLAFAVVWHATQGSLIATLVPGLAAAAILQLPLYWWKVQGAGDSKLMMALGACLGAEPVLLITLYSYILFLPAGLFLIRRQRKQGRTSNLQLVPFGLFLFAATVTYYGLNPPI